jgi:DHA1 family bicyclomycin/chloramphenicol resistance-like MFS transporter
VGAGALCALSQNVFQLMAFRVLQAIGAGAAATVATAIVKDTYSGRKREITLAAVSAIAVLAPLVSPVVGGLILRFAPWRVAFVAQAILGAVVLAGAVALQETLGERLTGNPLRSLARLGTVLKNGTFSLLLVNFSLIGMASMAFISASPYIFQDTFGVSSQTYTYYYTVFSAGIALGPLAYIVLRRRVERTRILAACFVVSAASGALIVTLGQRGPWPFILSLFPGAIAFAASRPPSVFLMLGQH